MKRAIAVENFEKKVLSVSFHDSCFLVLGKEETFVAE